MDLCMKVVDAVKAELKMPNLKVNLQPVTSATAFRNCRPATSTRVRLDDEQRRASETGRVRTDLLRDQCHRGGQKELRHQEPRRPERQDDFHHVGTTSVPLLKKYDKTANVEIKEIYGKDHAESFLLLAQDRTSAFIMDDILLAGQIASSSNPGDYMIIQESLRQEPYSMMLRKDDPQFKALVDKTIGGVMKSGEINKIYSKWFHEPDSAQKHQHEFPGNAGDQGRVHEPERQGRLSRARKGAPSQQARGAGRIDGRPALFAFETNRRSARRMREAG
jgi:glutamate/aspartate transport system substrate-binding protein